jgi:hypothetical protein
MKVPSSQEVVASPVFHPAHTSTSFGETDRPPTAASEKQSRSSSRVPQKSSTSEKMVVFRDEAGTTRIAAPPSTTTFHSISVDSGYEELHIISSRGIHEVTEQPKVESNNLEPNTREENNNNAAAQVDLTAANPIQLAQQLQAIAIRRTALLQQLDALQHEESSVLALLTNKILEPPLIQRPWSPPIRPLNAPLLPKLAISPSRLPRKQPPKTLRKLTPLRLVSAPPISTPSSAGRRAAPSSRERVPLGNREELMVETGMGFREAPESLPIHAAARGLSLKTSRVPVDFGDEPDRRCPETKSPNKSLHLSGRAKSNRLDCNKHMSGSTGRPVGLPTLFSQLAPPRHVQGEERKTGNGVRDAGLLPPGRVRDGASHVGIYGAKGKTTGLPALVVRSARSGSWGRDWSRDLNVHHSRGLRAPMPQSAVRKPDTERRDGSSECVSVCTRRSG